MEPSDKLSKELEDTLIEQELTDTQQWAIIDAIIKECRLKYKVGWSEFLRSQKARRSEFGLAYDKALSDKEFRTALSFPIFRKGLGEYSIEDEIKSIMPNYLKDEKYKEFCQRYPEFVVPEKLSLR